MTDAAFWDKIAPRYAKSPVSDPTAYEDTLARVRTYLKADDTVLELGAGTGSTALKLAEGAGHYVASDISQGMIDIARAKPGAPDHLEFRVAGTDASAYQDLQPNTVLAFNLFHLVPNLEAALKDVASMLPKDGLLISKTPAIGEKWYIKPMIWAMQLVGKAPYVRSLKVGEVDQLIKDTGFRVIETGLYPPSTPSRFVVARKI